MAVQGSADICFVWDGAAEDCERRLTEAGVEIIVPDPDPAAAHVSDAPPSASTPATRTRTCWSGWSI